MRAVVFDKSLRIDADHPTPRPREGECLIRVRLAGICATDLAILHGYMGFRGVPGHEWVGVVDSGPPEWLHKRVAAEINCVCCVCDMCRRGLSNHCRDRSVIGILGRDGSFAEYVAVPVRNLHAVPDAISDEEAVFIEPLAAAYQVLAQCPIESRMNVSVIGPGRLGLLVAQVLKAAACRLTVIGRNERKLLLCEKFGIQPLHVRDLSPKADRDVVIDCTGHPEGLALAMKLVRPRGTIVLKSTHADDKCMALNLAPIVLNEVTLLGSRCGPFGEAIAALSRRAVEVLPMITRTFPLAEARAAFAAAADPEHVKVLLRVATR
jgi:threonine dehydrogenase-like Zn-dependent dehydrogenase